MHETIKVTNKACQQNLFCFGLLGKWWHRFQFMMLYSSLLNLPAIKDQKKRGTSFGCIMYVCASPGICATLKIDRHVQKCASCNDSSHGVGLVSSKFYILS